MITERLSRQIEFIVEMDKMKQIYRKNFVIGGERYETDAEHSWHLAIMAVLLAEYVDKAQVDVFKVLKMVLLHDVVEIDAGDTYCYDQQAGLDKAVRETQAADRLFGLLPDDQAREFRALWEEFEQKQSPEAKLANALDRLQPLLLHYHTHGKSWMLNNITSEKVKTRNQRTAEVSEELGRLVDEIIQDAVRKGYLKE